MGIAILSGVLDSQRSILQSQSNQASLSSSIASLSTEDGDSDDLTQLPSKFLACVSRVESGKRLRKEIFPKTQNPEVEILVSDNLKASKEADVIVLACKPNMVQDILAEDGIKQALKGKLVVSICAGLRIQQMKEWVDSSTKVVRAMPNTPCKVSQSNVKTCTVDFVRD